MKDQGQKLASAFLPKRPFLRGIARLMDFSGAFNRDAYQQILAQYDAELAKSDAEAMREIWEDVGESMRRAINQYEKEIHEGSRQ